MLELERLTHLVIGAAIEVHSQLGPGFLKSIYEKALCIELENRRMSFECQYSVPIFYDQKEVGRHRLDLLVEKQVVVELKCVKSLEDIHFATVKSYLKSLNLNHGLLLNFNATKLTIKRVIR